MTALLFGKLPAHGDFVARGLSDAQQHRWDTQLSAAMQAAQAEYGDAFADRFSAAPPWRCVVADGADWLAGALAPSIDRAGRTFPILLARRTADHGAAAGLAAACEDLLFAALPGGWTADELQQQAQAAAPVAAAAPPLPDGWWLDGAELLDSPPQPLPGAFPPNLITRMIAVTEQLA